MISQINTVKEGELLLVQAGKITRTIDFANINLLKTDENYNATSFNDLSGSKAYFTVLSATDTITSLVFSSSGIQGVSPSLKYPNRFTITSGLVTSAVSAIGTIEYKTLTGTIIPTLTSYQNSFYKFIVDESNTSPQQDVVTIKQFQTNQYYAVSGFFQRNPRVDISELRPFHFKLMPVGNALSAQPFVNNLGVDHRGNLRFFANAGYPVQYDTPLNWRIFYTEKIT